MVNNKLNRQVFNKQDFLNTVDTVFKELGVETPADVNPLDAVTVDEFFILYDKLFYDIPKEGEINSHRFLINESTEYAGADQLNEDIQALLDEIAQLREDLLAANNTIIDLTTQLATQSIKPSARPTMNRISATKSGTKSTTPSNTTPPPSSNTTSDNSTNTGGSTTSSGKFKLT